MPGSGLLTGTTVVKVTFKNINTAKTTAKKYRCVVKAAIEPEKPVEPEVVKATKITEAKVSTAKTMTVTFDGAVDTSSATAIKVMRGSTEAPVTAAYASDSKSVVLTSATPFAAGTYTITVGSFEPATVAVVKQAATTLKITNTTVANTKKATVSFQVLDQYGEPMDNYTGKKLTVQAYNTTKGHTIDVDTNTNKAYFVLDCATQNVSNATTGMYINSIDDTVNVVAYLTDNAGVSTTATLKIANIYMENLEFGEPELGTDKRVTIDKTYKLPYTATTNEGNDAKFDEETVSGTSIISRVFGNYTFVSSNVSAVDMGKFYVDKDGQMFFTAEGTPGTAVITAINNMTGTTTTLTIVVNDVPKMSSLDVADTSISWDTNLGGGSDKVEVKAAVVVYDQFGEVVDPKNVRNVKITGSDAYFSGKTIIPAGSGIDVKGLSSDGKYLVYTVDSSTGNRYKLKGQTVTFTYVSKAIGPKGYVTSSSKVFISDTIEPAALTIVTDPAATVVSGNSVKVKFSVYDQNQNKVTLTEMTKEGQAVWGYTTQQLTDNPASTVTYYAFVEDTSDLFGGNISLGNKDTDKKEYEVVLTSKIGNVAATDISRAGQFTISLKDGSRRVTSKNYSLSVIKPIKRYFVSTDASKYTAGDKVKVTIDAYSQDGALFNSLYNDTADVLVDVKGPENKTYKFSPKFENGVGQIELTAGKEGTYTVAVTSLNGTDVKCSNDPLAKFTVVGAAKAKLDAKADGMLYFVDSQGNPIKNGVSDQGTDLKYASVSVVDVTNGNKDITDKVYLNNTALKLTSNNKVQVLVQKDGDKTYISAIDKTTATPYDVKQFSVIVKDECTAGTGHFIKLTIDVDGYSWSTQAQAVTNTVKFDASFTMDSHLEAMKTAQMQGNKAAFALALENSFGAGKPNADTNYQAVSGAAAEIASNSALLVDTMYGKITSIAEMKTNMLDFKTEMGITKVSGDAITGGSGLTLGTIATKSAINADTTAEVEAAILAEINTKAAAHATIKNYINDYSIKVVYLSGNFTADGTTINYRLILTNKSTYKTLYVKDLTVTTAS